MKSQTEQDRVNDSVKLLDEIDSNWVDKVDLDTLDMTRNCILDQVFGNYEDALETYPVLKNDTFTSKYEDEWVSTIRSLKEKRN